MYAASKVGPWPILDLGAARTVDTTTTATPTIRNTSAPIIKLTTANLGSNSEAYLNERWTSASVQGATHYQGVGVLLKPLDDIISDDAPIYLDYSIQAWDFTTVNLILQPFIGFIDSGLTPTAGLDTTNNKVSHYANLPPTSFVDTDANGVIANGQLLLKDIVSGSIPTDQYLCIGFLFSESTTASNVSLEYTISAAYRTSALNTSYRGI